MHESIPGVTIPPPPREHTRAFDLIGYDSVNARVPGSAVSNFVKSN